MLSAVAAKGWATRRGGDTVSGSRERLGHPPPVGINTPPEIVVPWSEMSLFQRVVLVGSTTIKALADIFGVGEGFFLISTTPANGNRSQI